MTKIEANRMATKIGLMPLEDLALIKLMIAEQENNLKDDNWKKHTWIDDYYYIIHYEDGKVHYDYIGSRAYDKYINDDRAEWIERKDKTLFPTYEFLERKEFA